jgi:hypothetical protein
MGMSTVGRIPPAAAGAAARAPHSSNRTATDFIDRDVLYIENEYGYIGRILKPRT